MSRFDFIAAQDHKSLLSQRGIDRKGASVELLQIKMREYGRLRMWIEELKRDVEKARS